MKTPSSLLLMITMLTFGSLKASADAPIILTPSSMCCGGFIWSLDIDDFEMVVAPVNRVDDLCAALSIDPSQITYGTAASLGANNPGMTIITCDCVPSPGLSMYWSVTEATQLDNYAQFALEQANIR